ncbi:MAG: aromatic amino acid lyase [Actinomycetes bacterium]
MATAVLIDSAEHFDTAAVLAVADGAPLRLTPALVEALATRRRQVEGALAGEKPVYGVSTGMGAASDIRLDTAAQSLQQDNLMLARAVGSPPWLDEKSSRAAVAVRLQSFLNGDAGVSAELCVRLTDLLNHRLHPAIPATGVGASGEIIPLAHLGGCITGSGAFLDGAGARPAAEALAAAGLQPLRLGPKEGVALIEGVPVTTALALLHSRSSRLLADQATAVFAAGLCITGANQDPLDPLVARANAELAAVLDAVRRLAGAPSLPRALQAPLSFRVAGPALAHLLRSTVHLDSAVERATAGVTDSPAFLDGRFLGTAGFDAFDLAAALDGLRTAVIHLTEICAAQLHRLLDERVTGLSRQLSDRPGLHGGMVAVHKRAVGVTHQLLSCSRPSSLGAMETSLGQEDIQSYSIEAAMACSSALTGAREVLACELLALIQATRLAPGLPPAMRGQLPSLLAEVADVVPPGTGDRPYGLDISAITGVLADGWGHGLLGPQPSNPAL